MWLYFNPFKKQRCQYWLLFQLLGSSPSSPTRSVDLSFRQFENCLEGPVDKKKINLNDSTSVSNLQPLFKLNRCFVHLSQVVQSAWHRERFSHELCHSVHVNQSLPQGVQVGKESGLFVSSSFMVRPVTIRQERMERTYDKRSLCPPEPHSVTYNHSPSVVAGLSMSEALL